MRLTIAIALALTAAACAGDDADTGFSAGDDQTTTTAGAGGSGGDAAGPASGTTATSGSGSGGGDATSTTSSSTGGSGAACQQADAEPNDEPNEAVDLGTITDLDSTGVTAAGTFHEGGNSDWYRVVGTDIPKQNLVNPELKLSGDQVGGMCVYFKCTDPKATGFGVMCGLGSKKDEASIGGELLKGCCTTKSTMKPNIECWGTGDDSAEIYIEAFAANVVGQMCSDYSLDVHF